MRVRVRRATADDAEAFGAVVSAVADEGRWIATEPPLPSRSSSPGSTGRSPERDALWVLEDTTGVSSARSGCTPHAQPASCRWAYYRRRDGTLRSSLIMARLLEPQRGAQSRPGRGT
jgi:hypothetical protein